MNVHKNAKLTPRGRAEIVRRVIDQGQTPKAVATAFGVCERTVRKWVQRYQAEGAEGLRTAPRDPTSCAAQPRSRWSAGSSRCAGGAGPAPRSPPSSASPPQPSAASSGATGSTASRPSNRPSRSGATSARTQASSSISTSRSSDASTARDTASPATEPDTATHAASDGVPPRLHRRPLPRPPSHRSCRREEGQRHSLPQRRAGLLQEPRVTVSAS